MAITVTIVRHAETDSNVKRLVDSFTNGPINANGVKQAKELGVSLKNELYTRVNSSDLQRCQDTTKHILSELVTPIPEIVTDKRLRERHCGEWEGKPFEFAMKMAKERNENPFVMTPPGGESRQEALARFLGFFEELFQLADTSEMEENVLIVSHGLIIQIFITYLNERKDLFEVSNCEFDPWKHSGSTGVTKLRIGKVGGDGKRKIDFICLYSESHLSAKVDPHLEEAVKQAQEQTSAAGLQ